MTWRVPHASHSTDVSESGRHIKWTQRSRSGKSFSHNHLSPEEFTVLSSCLSVLCFLWPWQKVNLSFNWKRQEKRWVVAGYLPDKSLYMHVTHCSTQPSRKLAMPRASLSKPSRLIFMGLLIIILHLKDEESNKCWSKLDAGPIGAESPNPRPARSMCLFVLSQHQTLIHVLLFFMGPRWWKKNGKMPSTVSMYSPLITWMCFPFQEVDFSVKDGSGEGRPGEKEDIDRQTMGNNSRMHHYSVSL